MDDFLPILLDHLARYPAMEAQDVAKLAYQREFGPAHLADDLPRHTAALLEEWGSLPVDGEDRPPEAIGRGLYRFHLAPRPDWAAAAPLLALLTQHTAQTHRGTRADLKATLALLPQETVPHLSPWLAAWEGEGFPALSHSPAYHAAYHPHYRVVGADYAHYFPALLAVWTALQQKERVVVAIDGRCGSGKTTLAALLADLFAAPVLHMDDFYCPPARRPADWDTVPAGNMDLARFLEETLRPACRGEAIPYRPYDCAQDALLPLRPIPPAPLTVVEGSYSHHPLLAEHYDVRIFLTSDAAVQRRRLEGREGAGFAEFAALWIPFEERYIAACDIQHRAHLVLDTSHFF